MTPIWIFPAYPLLIIGPHAGVLATHLSPSRALPIMIGGFTIQGVGFLVSLMVYSAFIYRLMTQKLPRESLRPGMFVSVGPSAFTVAGVVNMAANAERIIPAFFMDEDDGHLVAKIIEVCAQWMSLWLWGLAIWFFLVSVGAHISAFFPQAAIDDGNGNPRNYYDISRPSDSSTNQLSPRNHRIKRPHISFSMTFFSFVFPNTALVTATFAIGKAFDTTAIKILGCVMTCLLILTWILVVIGMIRAIKNRVILWPEQGEDRDEGGFKMDDQIVHGIHSEDDVDRDDNGPSGEASHSRRRRFSHKLEGYRERSHLQLHLPLERKHTGAGQHRGNGNKSADENV